MPFTPQELEARSGELLEALAAHGVTAETARARSRHQVDAAVRDMVREFEGAQSSGQGIAALARAGIDPNLTLDEIMTPAMREELLRGEGRARATRRYQPALERAERYGYEALRRRLEGMIEAEGQGYARRQMVRQGIEAAAGEQPGRRAVEVAGRGIDYAATPGRPSALAVAVSMPRGELTAPADTRSQHHSAFQPREARSGRFAGPPVAAAMAARGGSELEQLGLTGVGIDYANPPPRAPAVGGFMNERAGPAYSPFVRQLPQALQPAADRAERFGNVGSSVLDEMIGVAPAARAGRDFAEGEVTRGVGNALMAAPSRFLGLPGWLLSTPADAQQPDPRIERIRKLDTDIGNREKAINELSRRTRDPDRLEILAAPHQQAIGALRAERTRLQDALDAEAAELRMRKDAADRGAEWAKTPFARRYPGASEALATAGALTSFALPYFRTRGAVQAYTSSVQDLDARIRTAVDRANNTRLSPSNRTQAANDARAMQAQRDALVAAGPAAGGHGRALAEGAVPFEATLVAPLIHDYLASGSDPSGELYSHVMHSINPIENPGGVLGRYGLGLGFGGVLGEAGHIIGGRGADVPAGHSGEVSALKKQYQAPRRRNR